MKTGADPLREITFSDVPAAVALAALDTLGLYLPPETHIHSRIRNVEVRKPGPFRIPTSFIIDGTVCAEYPLGAVIAM